MTGRATTERIYPPSARMWCARYGHKWVSRVGKVDDVCRVCGRLRPRRWWR